MKICICGCDGRMGHILIEQVLDNEACILIGGLEHESSLAIGRDIATLIGRPPIGHLVEQEAKVPFDAADVIIDFSLPDATATHAAAAAATGTALVVGTTGLDSTQIMALSAAAQKVPVLYSPNMSLGMNVLFSLVEQVSRILDENYNISILEMHHRTKIDVPSGTALELGRLAAFARNIDLDIHQMKDNTSQIHKKNSIGFSTIRGGDIIGEHTVLFIAHGERVELTHKVSARNVFARGAIHAAFWLWDRTPGLYSMRDVLDIREARAK